MTHSWMSFSALIPAIILVLGLCLGSFLNVVIHRLPQGLSIARPRSRCPGCKAPVAPIDNIPVLSYIMLRGRCRHCGERISPRYPIIELLGAGSLFAAAILSPDPLSAALRGLFLLAMLAVIFIDMDFGIIPDKITLPGTLIGLAIAPLLGVSYLNSLLGILVGAGWLLLVIAVYRILRGVVGMGGGDVKLAAMLGAWLGWQGVLATLFIGSFIGSLVGLTLIYLHRKDGQMTLPYGPFLGPAAAAVILVGPRLWGWLII